MTLGESRVLDSRDSGRMAWRARWTISEDRRRSAPAAAAPGFADCCGPVLTVDRVRDVTRSQRVWRM